jgi:hypothetical protein
MAIFAVLMPTPQPIVIGLIKELFPNDYLTLNDTQILISAPGTAEELTKRLGLGPIEEGNPPPTGSAVILKTSSYYGRAPTAVWDWMKTKLESSPSDR